MASQLKMLFEPIKIGPTTLRNRIVMTGHGNEMARDNSLTERHGYYYAERAKGGVGLLITGVQAVHPTTGSSPNDNVNAFDKRSIPGYRLVADMVHEHGAKILAQLWHGGFHNSSYAQGEWRELWAPSQRPCFVYHETAKAMSRSEIKEVVDGFIQSAVNVREGGFDGVQLHGGHGYLMMQFLSPLTNKRTDEYGGSLENRMRIYFEVIDGVRRAVGKDFVVGIRLSGDEALPGGLTIDDMVEISQRLEAHGGLDCMDISIGTWHAAIAVGTSSVPGGVLVPLASAIRSGLESTPVSVVVRINDPIQADKILVDGHADLVGMTRATICDPELPNKAREGRFDEIRYCVACNQGCYGHYWKGYPITCVQNPAAGNEKKLGISTITPAAKKKKVMVVGGGPAGLKAAEVAAMRGHKVVVYERESELGGQVRIAAKAPNREEWGNIIRNLANSLQALGVTIKLNADVTEQTVAAESPDAVVVATGSTQRKTGFTPMLEGTDKVPGVDGENVVMAEDVLLGTVSVGKRVVILDDSAGYPGISTAELLADQGKDVEIITRFYHPAIDLDVTTEGPALTRRVCRKGVKVTPNSWVKEIGERSVICFQMFAKGDYVIKDVDTVVLATIDRKCTDELFDALEGKFKEIYKVGDCVAPRRLPNAIADGDRVGRLI